MPEGRETRRNDAIGVTHTHHFFTPRAALVLGRLAARATSAIRLALLGGYTVGTRMARFLVPQYFNHSTGPMKPLTPGTLYIPTIEGEQNWLNVASARLQAVARSLTAWPSIRPAVLTGTCSASQHSTMESNSTDYIFTDPPFGGTQQYGELNFLFEAFLGVRTDIMAETVTNESRQVDLVMYRQGMAAALKEYYRCLKPGRWMTLKFHNSSNVVWNAIQEALEAAGFVIADLRILDTMHRTFLQVTSASTVQKDLILSCYRPRSEFENRFESLKGKPEGVLEFLRQHLGMLPVAATNPDGRLQTVAERTRFLLFDRMLAYHLQRGARIPLSAAEFYALLEQEFGPARDDMYFLPDQKARYDAVRARTDVETLSLFVKDERTAVQWVTARLSEQPQTLGELVPKLMQELHGLESYENLPELRDILKERFICNDDSKWRVPDPEKEKDLEALRRKNLLNVFDGYAKDRGQLKSFRKEAVIEGFKHCWQTKQYGVIVQVCEKIPAKILQEVPEFVQFYDIAKDLAPEQLGQLDFTWEA